MLVAGLQQWQLPGMLPAYWNNAIAFLPSLESKPVHMKESMERAVGSGGEMVCACGAE